MHDNQPFLDARGQLALARALRPCDPQLAAQHLSGAFRLVFEEAFRDCTGPIPPQVAQEAPLAFAFLAGQALGAARDEAQVHAAALAHAEREELAAAARRLDRTTPTAQVLLQQIRAGEEVRLLAHSLRYDEDEDGLAGTNAFGLDYFWTRDVTVTAVAAWRQQLIDGGTIGRRPPPLNLDVFERWDSSGATRAVEEEVDALLAGHGLEFGEQLQDVVIYAERFFQDKRVLTAQWVIGLADIDICVIGGQAVPLAEAWEAR